MPLSFLSIVYGKPILPTSSNSPSPVPFLQGGGGVARAGGEDVTDKDRGKGGGESNDGQILPPPSVDNIPRPLSPTKLTPVGKYQRIKLNSSVRSHEFPLVSFAKSMIEVCVTVNATELWIFRFPTTAHSQLRYQSDADLEVLRRRLSNAPRPLKKRSSITEPEGPQGPNIQKLLYQRSVLL